MTVYQNTLEMLELAQQAAADALAAGDEATAVLWARRARQHRDELAAYEQN